MTESIPTTWNDERDGAFFGIAHALTADADLSAQLQRMLQDLAVAESWESMAARSAERAQRHERDCVPAPVAVPVSVAAPRRSRR